jgi:hypothetical protein
MAYYKYPHILTQWDHEQFDKIYEPGKYSGWSGIYGCEGCGKDVVHTTDHPLPPQNYDQQINTRQHRQRFAIVTEK